MQNFKLYQTHFLPCWQKELNTAYYYIISLIILKPSKFKVHGFRLLSVKTLFIHRYLCKIPDRKIALFKLFFGFPLVLFNSTCFFVEVCLYKHTIVLPPLQAASEKTSFFYPASGYLFIILFE